MSLLALRSASFNDYFFIGDFPQVLLIPADEPHLPLSNAWLDICTNFAQVLPNFRYYEFLEEILVNLPTWYAL